MNRRRTTALVVALAMALAACGGDDGDESAAAGDGAPTTAAPSDTGGTTGATGTTGDGEATEPGGPLVVEHRYGTTELDAAPERIVSLSTQWTDVLVALDAPLVGVGLDPTVPSGRYPWQDLPDGIEEIAASDALPFEAVAALQPDLIAVSFFAVEEADYERLSQIAPTIPLLGDEQVDAWQDMATVAGELLGVEDEAAALVAEAEAESAAVLDELPGLEGLTFALANYVPGDAIYVVADPDDGASTLFAQLRMAVDPEVLAQGEAAGRLELSFEQIDQLDADVLIMLTGGVDTDDIAGLDALPAVGSGAFVEMALEDVVGLNTPTPLSIPYVLDLIRPALEAAAA